jgi:methionyl-tRNA formyltransferase
MVTAALPIRMGDLNLLDLDALAPALDADLIVVFGASFIRGPLCDVLVRQQAINIHMGISPKYRGSSCNFWALYDRRPDLVGATIHRLSHGLDSGPMLFHALPAAEACDGFLLGMKAVRAAQDGLIAAIRSGELWSMPPVAQDRTREIRYSRNADFTDAVAEEYLNRLPDTTEIESVLQARDPAGFLQYALSA